MRDLHFRGVFGLQSAEPDQEACSAETHARALELLRRSPEAGVRHQSEILSSPRTPRSNIEHVRDPQHFGADLGNTIDEERDQHLDLRIDQQLHQAIHEQGYQPSDQQGYQQQMDQPIDQQIHDQRDQQRDQQHIDLKYINKFISNRFTNA